LKTCISKFLTSLCVCDSSLPKTDYTYSPMSLHRHEVIPGVMSLPNMSRPRVGALGMRSLSTASSTCSSLGTVDYDHSVQMTTTNSRVQTSFFSRMWMFVWLLVSTSVQSIREYWSESTTSVYGLSKFNLFTRLIFLGYSNNFLSEDAAMTNPFLALFKFSLNTAVGSFIRKHSDLLSVGCIICSGQFIL